MRIIWVSLISAALASAPTHTEAQAILRMEDRTVEVVGLRQWTLPQLQDSLAAYGDSLHSHACAATLRYKLGFAEAASSTFVMDGSRYVLVTLVEPQDSARVRHRDLPMDTTFRAEWAAAGEVLVRQPWLFHIAVDQYEPDGSAELDEWLRSRLRGDTIAVRALWNFLDAHRGEEDFRTAITALRSSPSLYDRMTAAAILANFAERDETWWALVDALRERDGAVKAVAGSVLSARAKANPREVEWGPVASSIHALLNGTGLFELSRTLDWLPRMGAGPRWGSLFLAGGGEMLLDYLAAEHPPTRDAAHSFLVVMRGTDPGADPAVWRSWIESLPEPANR